MVRHQWSEGQHWPNDPEVDHKTNKGDRYQAEEEEEEK